MTRITEKAVAFRRGITVSITKKYNLLFSLYLLLILVVFAVSFFSGTLMKNRYESAMNELLDLNDLFIQVDNTNVDLYNYQLYFVEGSREAFLDSSDATRNSVNNIIQQMGEKYSRDVVDLCNTVITFLEQSMSYVDRLNVTSTSQGRIALEGDYAEIQNTISYINQSFKDIYSSKLVSTQLMEQNLNRLYQLFNLILLGLFLVLVILCFFFYMQAIKVTGSIKKLTVFANSITHVKNGDERIIINSNDEIAVFASAFNDMLDTIRNQIHQIEENSNMRDRLQQAEVENLQISGALQSSQLRLLQSRINPHFLFNTLNMITQTAHMEDAEETARLMEATADLLRYNLGKVTKAVTLLDEIDNVRNYVYIQQCRYGKRIAFRFETDSSCEKIEVPCMILQPLVENSIAHGVGSMIRGGEVIIRLFLADGRVCLDVEDNGVGIKEEQLHLLLSNLQEKNSADEHIGLKSVYIRLKHFFSDRIEFGIDSHPGRTVVHIGFPIDEA